MSFEAKNFQIDVLEKKKPVVVDFWAPWCRPCLSLKAVLEEASKQAKGLWELVKVNVDVHQELASKYDIQSIPQVKLFVNGEVVDGFVGATTPDKFNQWILNAISNKI